jgi:predicted acetyltransferase
MEDLIMEKIKLIIPIKEYAEQVMNYKQEFINNNEEIHGDGG